MLRIWHAIRFFIPSRYNPFVPPMSHLTDAILQKISPTRSLSEESVLELLEYACEFPSIWEPAEFMMSEGDVRMAQHWLYKKGDEKIRLLAECLPRLYRLLEQADTRPTFQVNKTYNAGSSSADLDISGLVSDEKTSRRLIANI